MHTERLRADTELVRRNIEALKSACPELADDTELLANTIEGETDFDKVLDAVMETYADAVMMRDGSRLRASELRDRGDRFETKAEAMRRLALELLQAAGLSGHKLPIATLTVRPGLQSVYVESVDELAKLQGFVRTEVIPRKDEIRKALLAGEAVPGARLETGPTTLAIRVK